MNYFKHLFVLSLLVLSTSAYGYTVESWQRYKVCERQREQAIGVGCTGIDMNDSDLSSMVRICRNQIAQTRANLTCDLSETDLSGIRPTDDFSFSFYSSVYFGGSNLQDSTVRFWGFDPIFIDFSHANLQDTRIFLSEPQQLTLDFSGANIMGTEIRLLDDSKPRVIWTGAKYDEDTTFPYNFNPADHGMVKCSWWGWVCSK